MRLCLGTITCFDTEDSCGGDELYIKVDGNWIWTAPEDANEGQTLYIDKTIDNISNDSVTIELKDDDSPDRDDSLGKSTLYPKPKDIGKIFYTEFKGDGAHYVLTYQFKN
jgi:hypothetical protein